MNKKKLVVLIAVSYGVGVLVLNYLFGFMAFEYQRGSSQARELASAIIFPLLTSLSLVGIVFSLQVSIGNLAPLIAYRKPKNHEQIETLLSGIFFKNYLRKLPYVVLMTLFAVYVYWQSLQNSHLYSVQAKQYLLVTQAIPLWFCMFSFILSVMIVMRIMAKHVSKSLRVRLFEIERMQPFGNVILVNFFITSVLLSVYQIQLFFGPLLLAEIILTALFMLTAVTLFIWTIYVMRLKLHGSREVMLDRINESLNIQLSKAPETLSARRLVDDKLRVQFISDLLMVRKEIGQINLIPIDLPLTYKLVLLMLLPFVSWVGAALVSQTLQSVVS